MTRDVTDEQPLSGRCGARTRSRGRVRGARGKFCRQFPMRGELRCKLHGGAGAAEKRGKPSPAMTHGLRSRFRDEEAQHYYEAAREDIEKTGGLDVLTDLAAHRVSRLQAFYRESAPEGEAIERTDAALRAELTVKGLVETRHKIESDRADPDKDGELMVVAIPAYLSHSEPPADPSLLLHISGETRPAIKNPGGQLLLEWDGGWYLAIEETVDGQPRFWTLPEKMASRPRRPLALVGDMPEEQSYP